MATVFTENGLAFLAGLNDGDTPSLRLALLTQVPIDFEGDYLPFPSGTTLLSDLLTVPERWREMSDPNYVREELYFAEVNAVSGTTYLCVPASVEFNMDIQPAPVKAFALLYSVGNTHDHVLCVFDDPLVYYTYPHFLDGNILNVPADPDVTVASVPQRWMLGWTGANTLADPLKVTANGMSVSLQSIPFSAAGAQTVWVLPQRVNYIANPSFERSNTDFWRVSENSTLDVVTSESDPIDGVSFGWLQSGKHAMVAYNTEVLSQSFLSKYDPSRRIYVAANSVSHYEEQYTFQAKVSGRGYLRVGLAGYFPDSDSYITDWGLKQDGLNEEWELQPSGAMSISGLRNKIDSDINDARLVFEARGYFEGETFVPPVLVLDDVLLEPGALIDWPYFDGDSTYGMESIQGDADSSDYSWYGNVPYADKQGASYSLWYNHKSVIAGRLFGRVVDDDALYTSTDEQSDGLVYQWAPAGAVFIPKFNVLTSLDPQIPPAPDPIATWPYLKTVPEYTQVFGAYFADPDNNRLDTIDIFDTGTGLKTYYSVPFIDEEAFPIARAYLVHSEGVTDVTIEYQQYNPLPFVPDWDLYDGLIKEVLQNRYIFSWDNPVPTETLTLYVERGPAKSPRSWEAIPMSNYFNGWAEGGGAPNVPLILHSGTEWVTTRAYGADLALSAPTAMVDVVAHNASFADAENVDDTVLVSVDAFSARAVDGNLWMWLDGSDSTAMVLSSGNKVATWYDWTTYNNDAVQATAANRPVLTGTQNGLTYVSRNDSGQSMTAPVVEPYGHLSYTLVAVVRRTELSADSAFFATSWPNGRSLGYNATGKIRMVAPGFHDISTVSSSTNDFEVVVLVIENNSFGVNSKQTTIYLNDVVVLPTQTTQSSDSLNATYLFDVPGWSDSDIDIAEIMFYRKALSAGEVSAVTTQLMTKWGI